MRNKQVADLLCRNNTLECRLKALEHENLSYKSGEKYAEMQKAHKNEMDKKDYQIKKLMEAVSTLKKKLDRAGRCWMEVIEDVVKEMEKKLLAKDKELLKMEKKWQMACAEADMYHQKMKEEIHKKYQNGTELEKANEQIRKLTAQKNRDFHTSSTPSSMKIGKKEISNSRVKTGRIPGGQFGHEGHRRSWSDVDTNKNVIQLPIPEEVLLHPEDYRKGKILRRQNTRIEINVIVDEYVAQEYIDIHDGKKVHSPFPETVVNESNYDGSVKAFAYLFNNYCNVSIDKITGLIRDLTGGKLSLSKGLVSNLVEEFACKSAPEQEKAIQAVFTQEFVNADFTNSSVNGDGRQVLVVTGKNNIGVYMFREHKGHLGIKGTPLENYFGIIVNDHDLTFYNYGSDNQECISHVLRYLEDSIRNEPDRTWSKQMKELLQEIIHYVKHLPEEKQELDESVIETFENRYDEIIKLAEKEYEDVPATFGYVEGKRLFNRLKKYKHNHLLFLSNLSIEYSNNRAERKGRVFKRKMKSAITFRSDISCDNVCRGLTAMDYIRFGEGKIMFDEMKKIFNRSRKNASVLLEEVQKKPSGDISTEAA